MQLPFDGATLALALRTTFERRRTEIPTAAPLALTLAFAEVEGKRAQWASFLRRSRITTAPEDLAAVIDGLAPFLGPVLAATGRDQQFAETWPPGGPWGAAS